MSVKINADTTNGVVITSDTSGEIKLQSAGTAIATVTANGIDVTGDFTVDTTTLHVDAGSGNAGYAIVSGGESATLVINGDTDNSGDSSTSDSKLVFTGDGSYDSSVNNGFGAYSYVIHQINQSGDSELAFTETRASGTTSERMRLTAVGNLAFNNTADSDPDDGIILRRDAGYGIIDVGHPTGSTATGSYIRFLYNGTMIGRVAGATTSSVSYNTTSDYRLKENKVDITDGIERVKLLKPCKFNFITDPDITMDGFFAHEVQDVVPEAIDGEKDAVDDEGNPEYQGIDQSKLVPLLTAALKEAITKIEDLETRIEALENA